MYCRLDGEAYVYTAIRDHAESRVESVGHLMARTFLKCISETPKICLSCVASDFDRFGFSYLRRQHQIVCNVVCGEHQEKLLSVCPSCQAPLVENEIPSLRCRSCGKNPRNGELVDFESAKQLKVFRRIATAVSAIFAGEIVGNINLHNYLRCVGRTILPEDVLDAGLADNIVRRCGEQYLVDQRMHPNRKPHFGWPAIYVAGNGGGSNPIMELLLYGADKLDRSVENLWGNTANSYGGRGRHSHSTIDLSVLKALFRYMTVMETATKLGLEFSSVNSFVHAYPLLREKLDRMRTRRLTKTHRDSVLMFLKEKPDATLMDLKFGLLSAYRYLRRNDMEWWKAATCR